MVLRIAFCRDIQGTLPTLFDAPVNHLARYLVCKRFSVSGLGLNPTPWTLLTFLQDTSFARGEIPLPPFGGEGEWGHNAHAPHEETFSSDQKQCQPATQLTRHRDVAVSH